LFQIYTMFDYLSKNSEKNYISIAQKDKLLSYLKENYELDLFNYSEASVRRRISKILNEHRFQTVEEYLEHLEKSENAVDEFLDRFTVNVTEMFRDPYCYLGLVKNSFPIFERLDKVKIWSAGCSTGEETLSLAILLHEYGLLDRCEILATDYSEAALNKAREATYKIRHLKNYASAYATAGGKKQLEDYYKAKDHHEATFNQQLLQNIEYQKHNLIEPAPDKDFDLIICRNVLIYFNPFMQNQVLENLTRAMVIGGDLFIGSKETILFYQQSNRLKEVEPEIKLYRKLR